MSLQHIILGILRVEGSQSGYDLKQIIERIGLLQLDSISVVARSHYLVMLARHRR